MVPSVEVRIVPPLPTVTKVLFSKVTSKRSFDVPEVLSVQEVPSEEVRMVPFAPTATYKEDDVSEDDVSSLNSLFTQEE